MSDTDEYYTKQMLVDKITKVLPESKIKYVKKYEDPRDYSVNCDKIKNELGLKTIITVSDGIMGIIRVIEEKIIQDSGNQKYFKIPHE